MKVKYIYIVIILILEYILVSSLELLDNTQVIFTVFTLLIIGGFFLKTVYKDKIDWLSDIGWAILYGTLIAFCFVICMFIMLMALMP